MDTWHARNSHIHGENPHKSCQIERQNTIIRAKQLFLEGKDSVPRNKQRLFGQFDRRITENTRAIKLWIVEVERAQKKGDERIISQPA